MLAAAVAVSAGCSDGTPRKRGDAGPAATLAVPTGVVATALSPNSIRVVWEDTNTAETGYVVERSLSPEADFVAVVTTAAGTVQFDDTGLTPQTTYHYRVRAVGASDSTSDYSPVVSATTLEQTATPLVVVLTTPVDGTTITEAQTLELAAQVPAAAGVESVEFYVGTTLLATVSAAPFATTWTVTGADNGTPSLTAARMSRSCIWAARWRSHEPAGCAWRAPAMIISRPKLVADGPEFEPPELERWVGELRASRRRWAIGMGEGSSHVGGEAA